MDSNSSQEQASLKLQAGGLNRAPSSENQEIFVLPRQRSSGRRESRMFLVDGQLCWADDAPAGFTRGKRQSSVGLMFGSSMDLSGIGQSIDSSGGAGSGSEEAISYRIKWCRENIVQLKRQTWPMERKLQVLRASKMFIKQHQGELKQSKQAKDVIANTNALFDRYWRHFKREFANFLVIITPWEMRIKKIESHFGSVVASYFTFLRWIFWLNLANSLVMCSFVMVPELIENVPDATGMRKGELGMQQPLAEDGRPKQPPEFNPTLGEMWEFEGFLKFSPIFYGYYGNVEISRSGFWRNPLAFLMSAMLTYLFCFFCISRKLSQNTKLSRIGSKDDEYTFCWTVFVGWDFMIGNSETAYNKTSSLVMNLKEGILEEKEQTKDRNWRLIIRRVLANVLTIMLIVASAYVVTLAVQRSENLPEDASLLQKNELQLVMSGIQFMFPPLFDVIGIIEQYHPRKALSWQLGRILFLDFLNFYTLMFSLFGTVDQMGVQLNEVSGNITLLRKNATYYHNLFTTTTTTTTSTTTTTTLAPETTTMSAMIEQNFTAILNETSKTNSSYEAGPESTPIVAATTSMLPESTSTTTTSTTTTTTTEAPPSTTLVQSTTPTLQSTSAQPASTTNIGSKEDEDYPDLGEVLKMNPANTRGRRRRRRRQTGSGRPRPNSDAEDDRLHSDDQSDDVDKIDQIEREFASTSEELIRRRTTTNNRSKNSPRVYVPYLPPIRDPYRRAGAATTAAIPAVADDNAEALEQDDELLEGRLQVRRRPSANATTSGRRPNSAGGGGPIARPIGGGGARQRGGRFQQPASTPTARLDDDMNEDADGATESTAPASSVTGEFLFEPTTPTELNQQVTSDYSILLPSSGDSHLGATTTSSTATAIDGNTSNQSGESEQPQQQQQAIQGKSALAPASPPASSTGNDGGQTEAASPSASDPSAVLVTSASDCPLSTVSIVGSNGTAFSSLKQAKKPNVTDEGYSDCLEIPDVKPQEILALNSTLKDKLKSLCWETMFGQEMVKIVVMDLVMTVISAISFEFMRACFVRYCNRFFFWDLERGFPGYQDFKLAENVLHLVNNQSTVWMGMFFAPGLPAINTIKLALLMYIRSWAVLTCNIPHETVFKVSKSNNFYYWILLINLLICILPVAYAVTWIRPSWHCGPFGGECRMYIVVTKLIKSLLPPEANSVFKYLTSPGAVIPTLIALILIIYYLASTVSSSKEANKELKAQLKKDKEQEAAVPEITNTTVVDSSAAAPPASGGATGNTVGAATSSGAPGLGVPAVGGAQSGLPREVSQLRPTAAAATEATQPKSLLMPPPI